MSEYDGPPITRVGKVVTITFKSETSAHGFVEGLKKAWKQKAKRLRKQERVTKHDFKKAGVWARRTNKY